MELCGDCNMEVRESCGAGIELCNSPDTPRGRANALKMLDALNAAGINIIDVLADIPDATDE